jgi:hypothetical protein
VQAEGRTKQNEVFVFYPEAQPFFGDEKEKQEIQEILWHPRPGL